MRRWIQGDRQAFATSTTTKGSEHMAVTTTKPETDGNVGMRLVSAALGVRCALSLGDIDQARLGLTDVREELGAVEQRLTVAVSPHSSGAGTAGGGGATPSWHHPRLAGEGA